MQHLSGKISRSANGFTLLELMAVVAIIIVLTTFSAPFLGGLYVNYKARAASDHMLATFKFCQIEALKRKKKVFCHMVTYTDREQIFSKLYIDSDENNKLDKDKDALVSAGLISSSGLLSLQPATTTIIYNRSGRTELGSNAQIKLCAGINGQHKQLFTINIAVQGNPTLEDGSNADC